MLLPLIAWLTSCVVLPCCHPSPPSPLPPLLLQLSQVVVADTQEPSSPKRKFNFHQPPTTGPSDALLHVFEHTPGAKFCEELFGHYLLPNGRLAHFCLSASAALQGHQVSPVPPPVTPWRARDWHLGSFPAAPVEQVVSMCKAVASQTGQLLRVPQPAWVPVPCLAPRPLTGVLTGTWEASSGQLQLAPGPLRFKAEVVVTYHWEEHQEMPEKPKGKKGAKK